MAQQPFGWLWRVRFDELEQQGRINNNNSTSSNTYYTVKTQENRPITIKNALEYLQEEHLLVNKISDAILNNELASGSTATYSTDQLVQAIKQKYYPSASEGQINSVLSNLAGQINMVATVTNNVRPDHQVTIWQS